MKFVLTKRAAKTCREAAEKTWMLGVSSMWFFILDHVNQVPASGGLGVMAYSWGLVAGVYAIGFIALNGLLLLAIVGDLINATREPAGSSQK